MAPIVTRDRQKVIRADTGFADRLLQKRIEAGLTHKMLAEMVGVTVDTISNWENGRRRPALGLHMKTLAEVLVTTVPFLMFGEGVDL